MNKPPDGSEFDMETTYTSQSSALVHPARTSGTKRQRYDTPTDQSNESLSQLTNDNLLPLVDVKSQCAGCSEVVEEHYVLRCSECKRRFHGNCAILPGRKKKGVMPADSHIKYFNNHCIARVNGDYVGGRFSWTCSSCISLKEESGKECSPDRYSMLETIVTKNNKQYESSFGSINQTLKVLNKKIDDLSFSKIGSSGTTADIAVSNTDEDGHSQRISGSYRQTNLSSCGDPWKRALLSGSELSRDPAPSVNHSIGSLSGTTPPSPPPGQQNKNKFNFRIRVFTKDADKLILPVLKDLSKEKKLETFDDFRLRGKSTLDFLFATGEEAHAAYTKISKVFDSLDYVGCFSPDLIKSQRAFLVGVSQSDDAESIRSQIHTRYPELELTSKNRYNFKVLPPKQCKNEGSGYRSTVFFSPDLFDYISVNFNNRLRMGNYESWSIYPCKINRCSKCQSLHHATDDCKAKSPVCANCSGNHWTRKCDAKDSDICCINCKKSTEHKDDAIGHKASSSECPVYLNMTKNS